MKVFKYLRAAGSDLKAAWVLSSMVLRAVHSQKALSQAREWPLSSVPSASGAEVLPDNQRASDRPLTNGWGSGR